MMMKPVASLLLTMLALCACVPSVPFMAAPVGMAAMRGPLAVNNNGAPFRADEGAAARKKAEAACSAQGLVLKTSIYDHFERGSWHYREGCQ